MGHLGVISRTSQLQLSGGRRGDRLCVGVSEGHPKVSVEKLLLDGHKDGRGHGLSWAVFLEVVLRADSAWGITPGSVL